jgi:hypothetical protein
MKITFSKQEKLDLIETALSWLVIFMMSVYGFGKIMQFNGAIQIEKTLSELSGMELMWAFYGYSLPFALILGVFEVTGAVLLFFKRTRILGCFFITTILINIIIQDLVFEVHKGALYAAIIYQSCLLIILWMNKIKVIESFKILTEYNKPKRVLKKKISRFMILFTLFIFLFFFQHYLTKLLSYLS